MVNNSLIISVLIFTSKQFWFNLIIFFKILSKRVVKCKNVLQRITLSASNLNGGFHFDKFVLKMKKDSRSQFHPHFTCAFCANIFVPKNFKLQTHLCNFWHQNYLQKCTHKLLTKLTPDLKIFFNVQIQCLAV